MWGWLGWDMMGLGLRSHFPELRWIKSMTNRRYLLGRYQQAKLRTTIRTKPFSFPQKAWHEPAPCSVWYSWSFQCAWAEESQSPLCQRWNWQKGPPDCIVYCVQSKGKACGTQNAYFPNQKTKYIYLYLKGLGLYFVIFFWGELFCEVFFGV